MAAIQLGRKKKVGKKRGGKGGDGDGGGRKEKKKHRRDVDVGEDDEPSRPSKKSGEKGRGGDARRDGDGRDERKKKRTRRDEDEAAAHVAKDEDRGDRRSTKTKGADDERGASRRGRGTTGKIVAAEKDATGGRRGKQRGGSKRADDDSSMDEDSSTSGSSSGSGSGSSDSDSSASDDDRGEGIVGSGGRGVKEAAEDDEVSKSGGDSDDSSDEDEEENEEGRVASAPRGFTDENSSWLKPKGGDRRRRQKSQQLLSSSDEDEGEVGNDDEEEEGDELPDGDEYDVEETEEDGGGTEDVLEIERRSMVLDEERRAERVRAEEGMRHTIATQTAVYHLPTAEELEDDEDRVVPPAELRTRVQDILHVLADFKTRREPNRARVEYVDRLRDDVAELHGYLPELVQLFLDHFGPSETVEFVEASDRPRPLVIRTNTLKARRKDLAAALLKRGVNLDPLAPWSKVGLKIYDSPVPVGATPEYLAGRYMLQSAASMCPVMALSPQPTDRVLDVSAAPGGKTSYISQLMRNGGIVVANDLRPERQKATVANLHRLGVRNAVVCCHDGRVLGTKMGGSFHKVLLDAPCSGLGVISRDPSVKVQRTIKDIMKTVVLQKELILSAVDALKVGGVLVYSTCSVCIHENEEVVNYLLGKREVKLVDAGLDFGKPGFTRYQQRRFHPSLALTRRFYPHVHNMDGFYLAKIQKIGDGRSRISEGGIDKGVDAKFTTVKDEQLDKRRHGKDSNMNDGVRVDDNATDANDTKGLGNSGAQKSKAGVEKGHGKSEKKEKNRRKRSKVSKPKPSLSPPKKKSTNAKVTKPRREKVQEG